MYFWLDVVDDYCEVIGICDHNARGRGYVEVTPEVIFLQPFEWFYEYNEYVGTKCVALYGFMIDLY